MNTLSTIEVIIRVPKEVVSAYLLERGIDARVVSASKIFEHDNGSTKHVVGTIDEQTIEEESMHHGWFGRTHVICRYSIESTSSESTRIAIRTTYTMPWLFRSIFSWPMGHIVSQVVSANTITTTVSELVALERGRTSAAKLESPAHP